MHGKEYNLHDTYSRDDLKKDLMSCGVTEENFRSRRTLFVKWYDNIEYVEQLVQIAMNHKDQMVVQLKKDVEITKKKCLQEASIESCDRYLKTVNVSFLWMKKNREESSSVIKKAFEKNVSDFKSKIDLCRESSSNIVDSESASVAIKNCGFLVPFRDYAVKFRYRYSSMVEIGLNDIVQLQKSNSDLFTQSFSSSLKQKKDTFKDKERLKEKENRLREKEIKKLDLKWKDMGDIYLSDIIKKEFTTDTNQIEFATLQYQLAIHKNGIVDLYIIFDGKGSVPISANCSWINSDEFECYYPSKKTKKIVFTVDKQLHSIVSDSPKIRYCRINDDILKQFIYGLNKGIPFVSGCSH